MMYRIRGIKDFISFKNEECTCFGSVRLGEEKFLANQKTYNIAKSPINNPNKIMNQEHCFFKKGFKKSLKKHFTPLFHQEKTEKTIDANGSPCGLNKYDSMDRQKELRAVFDQQNNLNNFNQKTYTVHEEHLDSYYSVPNTKLPQSSNELKLNQVSYKTLPSLISTSPRTTILIPVLQSPKLIKINYNSPISQPIISNKQNEQKRNLSPVSMKSLNKSQSNANIEKNVQFLKQDDQHQLRKCQSSKEFQSSFPVNSLRKMSSEDEKYIKAEQKKMEQKFKLKRMDEVAEIYSEIDSEEELSDSDAESVVLGRLNEYSSTIDQDFSDISTIQRSTQGKVVRFNSLMTNFDFVRNQNQGASSQFLSY